MYSGHQAQVGSLAWSPDGTRLVSGSADGSARVWQVSSGEPLVSYRGHQGRVYSVAWSPDGRWIASGGEDTTVHLWEPDGTPLLMYQGHSAWIRRALAWSPDSRLVASGGWDRTVQVWEAASGERLLTYRGHRSSVHGVAWSPDGRSIISVELEGGDSARRWEVSTGEDWLSYEMSGGTLAWSPDGKRLAIVSVLPSLVEVWDADSGQKLAQQDSQEPADRWNLVQALAWSPSGEWLAGGGTDATVKVWAVAAMQKVEEE